jgi:hypothetical protein
MPERAVVCQARFHKSVAFPRHMMEIARLLPVESARNQKHHENEAREIDQRASLDKWNCEFRIKMEQKMNPARRLISHI